MKTMLVAAAVAASIWSTAALAQDAASGPTVSASLTGATNYEWRGVSQSNNHAAVFAAVNLAYNGFYASAGTENVDFGGIDQEYDLTGGYALSLAKGVKLDVGVVRYGYVDAASNIDTLEGKGALAVTVGRLGLTGSVYHTGNYFGSHHAATYYEGAANYGVTERLSLSGAFGHQTVNGQFGYNTWNLGASYAVIKGISLDLRYHDTDDSGALFGRLGKARLVGSFTASF